MYKYFSIESMNVLFFFECMCTITFLSVWKACSYSSVTIMKCTFHCNVNFPVYIFFSRLTHWLSPDYGCSRLFLASSCFNYCPCPSNSLKMDLTEIFSWNSDILAADNESNFIHYTNLNVTTPITALTNRGRSRHTLGDSVDCQEKYMGANQCCLGWGGPLKARSLWVMKWPSFVTLMVTMFTISVKSRRFWLW